MAAAGGEILVAEDWLAFLLLYENATAGKSERTQVSTPIDSIT
jgi:hypothetical protein